MKISIIGANSYIARNFTYYVKNQKSENIDLFLYDVQETQVDQEQNYAQIDFKDTNSLDRIKYDSDFIYVFTGKTGSLAGFQQFDLFLDINERSLLALLDSYVKNNGKGKIIFPSTRLVYKGISGALKENSEKEFKTVYAMNKFACENYLSMYNNVYGTPYTIFRICIPYGTMIQNASSYGTAEFLLGKARNNEEITLYGDGNQRRTLTYMGDLCEVLFKGGISIDCINDVYNIGGEDYSLLEMATLIGENYNVPVRNIPWPEKDLLIESGDTVFDSCKLDTLIGKLYKKSFSNWITE